MDIEDLSKSQLLLLTVLVNFVVSIATGVLTVSLLDQAPTTVTQTVNRIVDHTIETVTTEVPVIGSNPDNGPTTEELLTAAIAANVARTVTVSSGGNREIGVYLPSSRAVYVVSSSLPGHVSVTFANDSVLEADRSANDGNLKRYTFAADAALPQAPSAPLAKLADVKQGQTLIGLTADGKAVTGIVAKASAEGIEANLPGVPAGAAAVNLSGAIVGISLGNGIFLSSESLAALAAQ